MLPSQIIIIVAATRMHRVLIYFASKPSTVYETLQFLFFFPLSAADVVLENMRFLK